MSEDIENCEPSWTLLAPPVTSHREGTSDTTNFPSLSELTVVQEEEEHTEKVKDKDVEEP